MTEANVRQRGEWTERREYKRASTSKESSDSVVVIDRQVKIGEEHSESPNEGQANIEKENGRIVDLGETDESDGVRLCRASEGSAHRRHMVQLQSVG